jgi:MFS transporter, OFA family, oxalate/formate antiporter
MTPPTPRSTAAAPMGADDDTLLRSRLIARFPRSYGWLVLVVATIGTMMTTPGQTLGVSIFLDGIITDLHMSRSEVSTLYLIGTLLGSLILPFVGRFIDRRGPRLAVVTIAAAFALACVWMGFVQGTVSLLIGFTLVRALGQGSLSLVSVHAVAIWFVRRRGVAIGLLGIGTALWTSAFPSLVERLIEPFGWRTTYALLGALVALTILPLGALVFRDRPERFGLLPDGATPNVASSRPAEVNYRPEEARATLTYWLFVSGLVMASSFGTGQIFHHYAILAQGGLDRAVAAAAFVPIGVMSAIGNLGAGALIGRVPPRFLLSGMLLLLGLGLVMAGRLGGETSIWLYGAIIGIRSGIYGSLEGNVFAHYFGRAHIGAIRGQVFTAVVIGSALGPLLFAFGHDLTGSYTAVTILCALPAIALGLIAPFLRLRRGGRVR